ncbi:MAG: hypothetical protein V3U50_06345, partial [Acidimicrobiia bacterium]
MRTSNQYSSRTPGFLIVVIVGLLLTACGDSDETGAEATPATGLETTSTSGPGSTIAKGEGDAPQATDTTSVSAAGGFSGDLTIAGQSINLISGCVDTFDPTGTGTVMAQFQGEDGTTIDVVVTDGGSTVGVVQEGRIWSNVSDSEFTVEFDNDAGTLSGRGLVTEARTTANPEADETPVAAEVSAAWDPANPCP